MKLKIHNRTQRTKHFLPIPQKRVDKFFQEVFVLSTLSASLHRLYEIDFMMPIGIPIGIV